MHRKIGRKARIGIIAAAVASLLGITGIAAAAWLGTSTATAKVNANNWTAPTATVALAGVPEGGVIDGDKLSLDITFDNRANSVKADIVSINSVTVTPAGCLAVPTGAQLLALLDGSDNYTLPAGVGSTVHANEVVTVAGATETCSGKELSVSYTFTFQPVR